MDLSRLLLMRKPSRYLGCELNAARRPPNGTTLHIALAFPDLYEIGMSHVGLGILYHRLNQETWISAERVFLPDVDCQDLLRHHEIPLCTLETGTPLSRLDVLGFTLAYELTYTNLLAMLDLGRIPLRSRERSRAHPIVIGGGPCAFNPEPLSAFVDAFLIGDGEDRLPELCRLISEWKAAGEPRDSLLRALGREEGVYVPSLFDLRQDAAGKTWRLMPDTDRTMPVRKCTVSDLDAAAYPDRPVVPFARVVHDRLSIEAARGCPHACRFCQASVLYRPYRERSPERIQDIAMTGLKNTGYGDMSLLALSIGDYSGLLPLTASLIAGAMSCRVALSLPSVRVGSLDPAVVNEVLRVRKTGVTMAPEAATTRLRGIINKNIEENELFRSANLLAKRGWRTLKLYFMIGLPMEQDEDVEGIARLAKAIQSSGRTSRSGQFQLTVNVSTFVPKAHTPFQWEAQITRERAEEKQEFLKKTIRGPGLRLKWHDPRISLLEGVFARGDRAVCDLLEAAYRLGCRMDGWSEHFRYDLWEKAFASSSVDPGRYLDPYPSPDAPLPWDWIDPGVGKAFLVREHDRARLGRATPFRCAGRCDRCAQCSGPADAVCPLGEERESPAGESPHAGQRDTTTREPGTLDAVRRTHTSNVETATRASPEAGRPRPPSRRPDHGDRIRVTYRKMPPCTLLGHLETITVLYRALRRSGLPICFTEGEHPQPRVSFSQALPVGVESLAETMDVWLHEPLSPQLVCRRLDSELPNGFSVATAFRVPISSPSPEASVRWIEYVVSLPEDASGQPGRRQLGQAVQRFHAGSSNPGEHGTIREGAISSPVGRALEVEMSPDGAGARCRVFKVSDALLSPHRILGELFPDTDPKSMTLYVRKTRTSLAAETVFPRTPVD